MVKNAIESTTGIKVIGCIKRNDELKIGSRYLGLVTAAENKINDSYFKNLSLVIRNSVDINQIIKISSGASSTASFKSRIYNHARKENCRIGIAYNRAFTFYYPENIELLKKFGAKIVYFDPIADKTLPDVDGIYIGGGYPEIYAKELSGNKNLIAEIREKLEDGMPAFAECGGYMYLSKSIEVDSVEYPMVGSIPAVTHMEKLSLGYRTIKTAASGTILAEGEKIRGHEFHYSRIVFNDEHAEAYRFQNGNSEGYAYKQLLAGYAHLYFPSNQNVPGRFVKQCKDYRNRTNEIIY
jgi:cobyrinic acid a,c-diamide synthase